MSRKLTPEPLEHWRMRLGKSQREMAHYLAVHVQTYIQWENGRRKPPAIARRLFNVLQEVESAAPRLHDALAQSPPPGKPGRPTLPAWIRK